MHLTPTTQEIERERERVEAHRLHELWRAALAAKERDSSDAADQAEQDAYDALIDYIEAHGLNYSSMDPR